MSHNFFLSRAWCRRQRPFSFFFNTSLGSFCFTPDDQRQRGVTCVQGARWIRTKSELQAFFSFFLSAWGWVVFLQLRAWAWPSRLYGMWELCRDTWSGTYGFGALTSLLSARCLRSLGNWLLNASTWPADLLSPRWAVICCSCLLCPPQVLHVPPPEPLRSPSYCEILSPSSDCLFLSLCQQPHTNVGM